LSDQTLHDGIAEISDERIPLAIGFEQILNPRSHQPPATRIAFSVNMEDATVRQILDALCAEDPRYTWSTDGRTINVYPVATIGDPEYLMNRRIAVLRLRSMASPDPGLFAISRALPPGQNQVATAGIGGDDSYPLGPWTVTFRNLTVRQIVNRLAEHMGPRSAWVFYGSQEFRAFFFNKYGFNPSPPGPTAQGRPHRAPGRKRKPRPAQP
jgi:hypothetical protein